MSPKKKAQVSRGCSLNENFKNSASLIDADAGTDGDGGEEPEVDVLGELGELLFEQELEGFRSTALDRIDQSLVDAGDERDGAA